MITIPQLVVLISTLAIPVLIFHPIADIITEVCEKKFKKCHGGFCRLLLGLATAGVVMPIMVFAGLMLNKII